MEHYHWVSRWQRTSIQPNQLYSGLSELNLNDTPPQLRAYFMLSMTALCWGANSVFARLAVGEISPMALVSLRWIGVLLLILLFARKPVMTDWPVLKNHLGFVFLLGALGFACFNGLFYVAAYTTSAVNIGIIQGSIPVFVLIGVFLAYGQRISPLQCVGVVSTLLGVLIVAIGGNFSQLSELVFKHGDILMIIACSLYAGYAVALQRRPKVSSLGLFTILAASAFIASIPMLLAEASFGDLQWPSAKGWLIVVMVTLFPSFLAQIFFLQGVQLIGPGRAGIFVNLVPVFAAILAVLFLNEAFQVHHGIALTLVLGGIVLSEQGRR